METDKYEQAYYNMFDQKQHNKFESTDITDYTNLINDQLLRTEKNILDWQKLPQYDPQVNPDNSNNIQIALDAINKIKQALLEINKQVLVVADSLNK